MMGSSSPVGNIAAAAASTGGTPWWVTLIGYLLSGVLGALGVITGQRLAAKRDDARWERERERETERWAREDRTRFHNNRREIYARFLEPISALRSGVYTQGLIGRRHLPSVARQYLFRKGDLARALKAASDLLPEMELLGVDAAVVLEARKTLDIWMDVAIGDVAKATGAIVPRHDERIARAVETYERCLRLMRQDIDLVHSRYLPSP